MAPEVLMGKPYDQAADVYSYGIVIYEVCTRKKPSKRKVDSGYAFPDYAEQIRQTIGQDEFDRPEVQQMIKIGVQCIEYEPSQRPSFASILPSLELLKNNGFDK
jgi:serine/threonine protein kinase